MGFLGGAVEKNLPANAGDAGDVGLTPGSGISPGEGNGQPAIPSRWKEVPSPWGNAARDLMTILVNSLVCGFGFTSAPAQRAN